MLWEDYRVLSKVVMSSDLNFKGVTWPLCAEETVGGKERKLWKYCSDPGKK